jgi:demethylmenaquinone methyltransferase/2-methoxy-6-polyprenyl-1,4-benzoquinol methylase
VDHDQITPYQNDKPKQRQVADMFDRISGRYDFLNDLLSLGIHRSWRKKCVRLLEEKHPKTILDIASGTGDFAIACARLQPDKIVAADISRGMIAAGEKKVREKKMDGLISFQEGNAESLDLPANSFDAITVGFGVRNFSDLKAGLINMHRMLKPGGKVVILEFAWPRNPFVSALYNFYFRRITPLIGRMFSGDAKAYGYLTESVRAFPSFGQFAEIMEECGFKDVSYRSLSFGIAVIYSGGKS